MDISYGTHIGLLDPEDESTVDLQNVGKYLQADKA
jgi:hypothetical protein